MAGPSQVHSDQQQKQRIPRFPDRRGHDRLVQPWPGDRDRPGLGAGFLCPDTRRRWTV